MLRHHSESVLPIAGFMNSLYGHASLAEHPCQNLADRSRVIYNQNVGIHLPPYTVIHRMGRDFSLDRATEKTLIA
jgi:hypothetical protein